MIHEITLQNWVKHHNRTFKFQEGMNLIVGENEAGKSLIFESIDFALHGSVALRLPVSMYPNNLQVSMCFSVRGEDYFISRTPRKAALHRGRNAEGALIASGTKPVDAEVRKLLGYNRNVFMVSNYSSQDAIQYLSQLKPAERKRTIDNVVGLTAVEQVLLERKTELSLLRRTQGNLQASEVSAPEKPNSEPNPNIVKDIEDAEADVRKYSSIITTELTNKRQHEALEQSKPAPFERLPEDGWFDFSREQIYSHKVTKSQLENEKQRLTFDLNQLETNPVQRPAEVDKSGLLEGVTSDLIFKNHKLRQELRAKITFLESEIAKLPDLSGLDYMPVSEIEKIAEQEKLYVEWLDVQRLKKKGSITCNHCEGEVLLAIDHIQAHYLHVPEVVEEPVVSSQTMIKHNSDLETATAKEVQLKEELNLAQDELANFDENWYSEEALKRHLETEKLVEAFEHQIGVYADWSEARSTVSLNLDKVLLNIENFIKTQPSDEELEQLEVALRNKESNQKNIALLEQWEKSKNALEPFNEHNLTAAQNHLVLVTQNLERLRAEKSAWAEYHSKLSDYNIWSTKMEDANFAVSEETLAIETLNNFKAKIKTTILPSVNSVASTWMRRMSEESHSKVTLTDNMEILVGDAPIEALSISGRALGHLSLRMALGQVLTNSVFPVFMADEVDASMRDGRAQNVLDSLTDMLKGSMKQIIMISHRNLEQVDNRIEV